jgi:transcriptional regulator with XRE-family HTH domain
MPRPRRPTLVAEATFRNRAQLAELGSEVRLSRRRRRVTQQQLADRAGISQSVVSQAERGFGGNLSLDVWQRIFTALGRRLVIEAARDPVEEPRDVGHLALQELVLRLGRQAGYATTFELATKPAEPARSSDVGLRDDARRRLVLVECWNTFGDIGAAARASRRKTVEAEAHAIAVGGERPHPVHACWVIRATSRNRRLVARYPEVFASQLPGSSSGWVRALTLSQPPPGEPGLVWADVAATRIFAWRRPTREVRAPPGQERE